MQVAEFSNAELSAFKGFVSGFESCDWDSDEVQKVVKIAYSQAMILIKHLSAYLCEDEFEALLQNMWLHKMICNPYMADWYSKYDVANKDVMVQSTSNAGSSASMMAIKSYQNGGFLMLDLNRTPFGREAYTYLEGLSGLAVALH